MLLSHYKMHDRSASFAYLAGEACTPKNAQFYLPVRAGSYVLMSVYRGFPYHKERTDKRV